MLDNVRALCQVMRDSKLPRSALDRIVRKRLEAVLVSAYCHVPYYRELMQSAGYDPVREYRGPEDLSKLSITTKEILKQVGAQAFVVEDSDLSSCFSDATSGSTGIPLRVYRSPYERAVQIARWLRVLFLNGYAIHHKVVALVSPTRVAEGHSVVQRFRVLRRLTVDYVHHSPEEMVDLLLAYEPDVLYGNRSHLDLMALELKRRGIRPASLKLLLGGGEVIHDSSRQLYRTHFGVELVEYYGSIEMGVMAYETQAHDGLHLCEDLTYFEFLDQDGEPASPGEPGRVVVTDLTGKLMPFIRYDQGDLARFEYRSDANGSVSRVLTQVIGRENDYILLPDGTQHAAHDPCILVRKYEGVVQFRIVQRTRSLFEIRIVADSSYFLSIRDELMQKLEQKFPSPVSFEIVRVDQIAPDPSGKIREFISEVS
jgi:phenylacetate-CoA ligase